MVKTLFQFSCPQRMPWVMALASISLGSATAVGAYPLPPAADIPEEILQTQILAEPRSNLDGTVTTTTDYTLEQSQLRVKPEDVPARLAPEVHRLVFLLRLRQAIRSVLPFF